MADIELDANRVLTLRIAIQVGADRRCAFGDHGRRATVKDPERLMYLGADIHLQYDLVRPDLDGANAEDIVDRSGRIR